MYSVMKIIPWAFIALLSGHISASLGLDYADGSHEIEEFISSRKLREAGLKDFELSRLEHLENGNIIDSKILKRMKRSTSFQQPITLSVPAYGETFQLELMHVQSVLHPSATIWTRAGDAEETKWTGTHPDCFLAGSVKSHGGTASMSYCSEPVLFETKENHLNYSKEMESTHWTLILFWNYCELFKGVLDDAILKHQDCWRTGILLDLKFIRNISILFGL